MIRKFNYTNRQKIPREHIEVTLVNVGDRTYFNAILKSDGLKFPTDARVYIEPFYGPDFLRFDFGTFASFQQPENTDITELKSLSDRIYFHIKIVDESAETGLVLGEIKIYDLADDKNPRGKASILYVNPVKMDTNEIWRLNFNSNESMPVLEVNKAIEGIFDIAKGDPIFTSLVYPSAVRQIFHQIAFELDDFDEEGESWNCKWLQFGRQVLGVLDIPGEHSTDEEKEDWINNVVKSFCTRHKLFENYLAKINV
jgi:hypothetical protein